MSKPHSTKIVKTITPIDDSLRWLSRWGAAHPFLALSLWTSVLCWPLIVRGFPIAHDSGFHAVWTSHFTEQVLSGNLYPRWLPDMMEGLGTPTFFYYPPLAFYINTVFATVIDAYHYPHIILAISTCLFIFGGSVGMWGWARALALPSGASLFVAAIYALMPYRFLVDILHRGAFAEIAAMTIVPFLFWSASFVRISRKKSLLYTALCTGALLLTHPPTSLIVLPIIGLYIFSEVFSSYAKKNSTTALKATLHLLVAYSIGLALASFYILPALFIQNDAMHNMWQHHFYYENNFLFTHDFTGFSAIIDSTAVFTVVIACGILFWHVIRDFDWRIFSLCIAATTASFMMTKLSSPVYDIFPLLQKIQFPWRYCTLLTPIAALAAGLQLKHIQHNTSVFRFTRYAFLLLFTAVLSTNMRSIENNAFTKQTIDDLHEHNYGPQEHLLAWYDEGFFNSEHAVGRDNAKVQTWGDDTIIFQGPFYRDDIISLRRLHFEEWTSEPINAATIRKGDHKELLIEIHRDTPSLSIHITPHLAVRAGNPLSIAACIFLLITYCALRSNDTLRSRLPQSRSSRKLARSQNFSYQ